MKKLRDATRKISMLFVIMLYRVYEWLHSIIVTDCRYSQCSFTRARHLDRESGVSSLVIIKILISRLRRSPSVSEVY